MRAIGSLLVAVAVAVVVYSVRASWAPRPPPQVEPVSAPAPAVPCPVVPSDGEREARMQQVQLRLDQLRGWREALEGGDDAGDAMVLIDVDALVADLRAAGAEALPGQATDLVDVDCARRPCLALYEVEQDTKADTRNPALPLQAWFTDREGWAGRQVYAMARPDRDGQHILVALSIWEEPPTPESQGVALGRQKAMIRGFRGAREASP